MRNFRAHSTALVVVASWLAGCSGAPAPSAVGQSAASLSAAVTPKVVRIQDVPGPTTAIPKELLTTIGDLSNMFGVFGGVQSLLQLAGVFDQGSKIESDITDIEKQLSALLGTLLVKDKFDVLRAIVGYRQQAREAFDAVQAWVANGAPANDNGFNHADDISRDALYQLAGNDYLQTRLVAPNETSHPDHIVLNKVSPVDVWNQEEVADPYFTADGGMWDFRLFLPSLMEAVIARLTVIEGKYPGFGPKASDPVEMKQIVALLQPIADRISAGNGCVTAQDPNSQRWMTGCSNWLYRLSTGDYWYAYWDDFGGNGAAAVAAVQAQRDLDIGLTQLRGVITRVASYEQLPSTAIAGVSLYPLTLALPVTNVSFAAGGSTGFIGYTIGNPGAVKFSTSGLPDGVQVIIGTPDARVGDNFSVGFWTDGPRMPPTSGNVTITATANGVSRSNTIGVTVDACVPKTCEGVCGRISDGCGDTLSCPACPKCQPGWEWNPDDGRCEKSVTPPPCHGICK